MKKIKVSKNGPYVVEGNIPLGEEEVLVDENNNPLRWKRTKKYPRQASFLLCRCGKSKNKPYCDQSHIGGFDGNEAESAKRKYREMEEVYKGSVNKLHDASDLCAGVGFCYRMGGTWKLAAGSSKKDDKLARQQSCDCSSGRLVLENAKDGIIEPKFQKEISVTQEPMRGVSGPLWVKGEIAIESAKGEKYEKRNRVTLCRCGKSANKPFCDGSHHLTGFNDKN